VLVVAFGVAGSLDAARLVARSDQHRSQRALATTSANVVSNLRLAIQHEEDLALSMTAFIVATPNVSNTTFNQWLTTDRAFARYPELVGIARIGARPGAAACGVRKEGDQRSNRPAGP